ncbi:MAG: hypothetical protein V3W41_18630 [Planctomycetota bacterium]
MTEGLWKKSLAIFTLGFFGLCTAGAGLVDTLSSLPARKLIGDEAQQEQGKDRSAHFRDGSLAKRFEQGLRKKSRVRSWVLPVYAWNMFRFFDEGNQTIIAGKDGWIFLKDRVYVPPGYDDRIDKAIAPIAELNRKLKARGTTLVIMLVPRRSVVRGDRLPSGWDPHPEIEAKVMSVLAKHNIKATDLLPLFRSKVDDPLFHMVDSHWNDRAKVMASEAACRELGLVLPESERPNRLLVEYRCPAPGDLLGALGIAAGGTPIVPDSYDRIRPFDERRRRLRKQPNPESMPRIALTGTSYSYNTWITEYLYHFSGCRVHRASQPAVGATVPLRDFVKARKGDWPEFLVWEIPVYEIVHVKWGLKGLPEILTLLPE